jgi:TP901 family phage tail tape measure protein
LADVNANIGINFDTQQALAQLRQLQAGLSRFNQSLTQGNVAAENAQKGLNAQLMQSINATGKFVASQRVVADSTTAFTTALEKNQLSMGEYFRFTAAAATSNTKVFSKMFANERDIFNRARKDRVKALQTQYIQLTNANGDLVKVLQVVPKHLQMVNGQYADYATRTQMAAQKQQIMNQLLKQGSTQLLNFGKNTQWAGRQLMVGLTIPLTMLGSAAAKVFREMEQSVIAFTRVYGDMTTSGDATNKAVADIQRLAKEFTKYGIAAKDTVEMAAKAAAMGLTGNALNAQVIAATKLAVLGQVEQQQALETTISLQNAFGISAEELAKKINYLNAVENQTVLSIEDLTVAIPKAGPVVQQLGGSVEDLAFFMTAMKEGGINASEGANALKSGLASMINPSKKASEFLAGLGINIKGIVEANAGNLKGTIVGFARALDTLDPLNRARAIEQMFGKFQFARLSTLFQNVTKDGSQASRALGLASRSVEELAILSERELGKVEDAVGVKFQKTIEQLKLELIPIGKTFLQALTPVVEFLGKVLAKFNNFSDGTKKAITIVIGVVGGLAPVALMTFGLLMNALANGIKLFASLRNGMAKLNGQNNVLGGGFDYLTQQQIEQLAQTNALHTSHQELISTFNVEASAVQALANAYTNAASQARTLAASAPGLFNSVPGPAGAVSGLPKYAKGKKSEVVSVGGTGNKDSELALLMPGETVIGTKMSEKYGPLINAMIEDEVPGYRKQKKADIVQEHVGRGTGGYVRTSNVGPAALMGLGNQSDAEIDFSWLAQTENAQGEASDSVLSFASQMKSLVVASRNNGSVTERTYKELNKTWPGITDVVDELGIVYRSGLTETVEMTDETTGATVQVTRLKEGLTNIADYSAQQYPLVIEHIDQMERELRLTAEQAAEMRLAARRLIQPDVGTPANPGPDASERDTTRYETGLNSDGEEVITGIKMERIAVPGGPKTLKESAKKSIGWEADTRGQDAPVSSTLSAKEYKEQFGTQDYPQFAHLSKGEKGVVWDEPSMSISSVKGKKVPSAGEKAIPDLVRASKDDPTKKLHQGQVVAAPVIEVTEEDKALAEIAGAEVGQAAIDGASGPNGADNNSPSKKGKKIGKDITDGIIVGMQEGQPAVISQASQLGDAAVPTAAETRARVDKMDLGNKAFYDDINTPEMRDDRQVLKSLDRNRRKRGSRTTVDSVIEESSPSQTSELTIASSKRVEAATTQLAVKTEEAVTAQSQVVQQIKDESKTRVTIKGNTINVGKAREDADKAETEAATARSRAAALEKEQAKQKAKNSPTTITDEVVLAAKEKANALELEAAEKRQAAAMAELDGKNIVVSEEDVKDIGKVKKIQDKTQEEVINGTQEQGDLLRKTVDGSEDIADSTVLIADRTDELADATEDALSTQVGNNETLLTTSQLANATATNLGEVANATDLTGNAQQDVLESTQDIDEVNREIEEQKRIELQRLKDENARRAALSNAPVVPNGNQSGNKSVNPKTAMGSVEAYDYAMGRDPGTNGPDDPGEKGFTKNRRGQILFDPETNQPTTLKARQIAKKKSGMRAEKVGKYSGKAAGALGTATMVAGMAGAPPQVTAALGTAATVAQFAPMITKVMSNPYTAAAAALVAVAAGAYVLNKKLEGTAVAIAKFTRATTVGADMLKKIGEQTGTVGASEIMNRRRGEGQLDLYTNSQSRQGIKEATTFLQGEAGKALQNAYVSNASKNGSKVAGEQFALQIAAAVSDGTIAPTLAKDIAYQMGVNLKDTFAGISINAEIRKLIGPNGENLAKDPLTVRTRIANESSKLSTKLESDMNSNDRSTVGGNSKLAMFSTLGLIGAASGSDKSAALAVAGSSAIETAQAQADAMQVYYDTQMQSLTAELAATTNKQKQAEIEEKITKLKAEQIAGMSQMNNLVAAQLAKQERIATSLITSRSTNLQGGFFDSTFLDDARRREDAFFDAQKSDVKAKYKGTAQEASAQRVLNLGARADEDSSFRQKGMDIQEGKDAGRAFEAKINFLMQSGQMQPEQIETMMKIFEGKLQKMDVALRVGMRAHGGAKMAELSSLLGGMENKTKAQNIILKMARKNPKEFDKVGNALNILKRSDGLEIDMNAYIDVVGMPGLEKLAKKLDEIEQIPDPITKEAYVEWASKNNIDTSNMITDWSYYDKLPDKIRKEALQTFTTLYETSIAFTSQEAYDQWVMDQALSKAESAGEKGTSKYYQEKKRVIKLLTEVDGQKVGFQDERLNTGRSTIAQEGVVAIHGTAASILSNEAAGLNKDGGKKDRDTTFDDIMKRLRNVRLAALDAAGGFKELQKAIAATGGKAIKNQFNGLEQQLIKMGQTGQFTEYLAGLDTKDLKKFAYTATAEDVKKKKGKQKYTQVDPETGKMVTKYQKFKVGDTVLTQKGRDMEQGFKKAIIGDYNKAQLQSVTLAKQEIAARGKLLALGFSEVDIKEMLADENYKTLIATGKVTKQELETNAALTKQARIRNQINGAVAIQKGCTTSYSQPKENSRSY